MSGLIVFIWFVLGLIGLYLAFRIEPLGQDNAAFCCVILFGPILLIMVLAHCVQVTIQGKTEESE